MARLGGRGRHNGANAIVHLAREVVGRRRTLQNASQEVRNAVILDALADEDFRALDTTIAERTSSDKEFAQQLARLTYAAARAKGFDRCVVDAALRLDSLIPEDDPAHERDKLLRDAYHSAQKASYIRGGRLALGRLGRRAVEAGDLERARVLLHQQLDLGPEKDDTPAEVDSALVLGDILRREGDDDLAQTYYRRAATAAERLDYRQGVAEALVRQVDTTPSGNLDTVAALQQQALDAARRTGDRNLEARILVGLADTMVESGKTQDATVSFREALVIAREEGDLALEARCVTALATAYRDLGQPLDAIEAERDALAIEERLGNRPAAARWALTLGMSELQSRDPEAAIDAFERARILAAQINAGDIQQRAEGGLGIAYSLLRRGPETVDHLTRAIELARQAGDTAHEAQWVSSLGQAYWALGQVDDATHTTNEAITLAGETGNVSLQAELYTLLGQIYAAQRETIRARDCYTHALQLNRDLRQTGDQVSTLTALASLAADTGQYTQATQLFDQALGLAMSIDDRRSAATIHGRIGSLMVKRRETRSALDHFARAVEIAEALGDQRLLGRSLQHLATAQDVAGDPEAMSSYERAVTVADAAGDVRGGISMRLNMGLLLSRLDEAGATEDAIGWLSDAAAYAMESGSEYAELRAQAEAALEGISGLDSADTWDAPATSRRGDRYDDAADGYYRSEAPRSAYPGDSAYAPDDRHTGDAGWYDDEDEDEPLGYDVPGQPARDDRRVSARYRDSPDGGDRYEDDRPSGRTAGYRDAGYADDGYGDDEPYADEPWRPESGGDTYRAGSGYDDRYGDPGDGDDQYREPYDDRRGRGGESAPYAADDLAYRDQGWNDRYDGGYAPADDRGYAAPYDDGYDDQSRGSQGRASRRDATRRGDSRQSLDDDPTEPEDGVRQRATGGRWSLRDRLAWNRRDHRSLPPPDYDSETGHYSDH